MAQLRAIDPMFDKRLSHKVYDRGQPLRMLRKQNGMTGYGDLAYRQPDDVISKKHAAEGK